MNPIQEAKQELEASIRYAENAISSAQATIESMGKYQEQTGREKALQNQLDELKSEGGRQAELIDDMRASAFADANTIKHLKEANMSLVCDNDDLKDKVQELESKVQGQYDDIVLLQRDVEFYTKEYNSLLKEKQASSGPCGCQAYRDLEEKVATMPVIPRDVAIAIFREGIKQGVDDACNELRGQTISIRENDYVGDFEVSFTRDIELDDELDLDWVRDKVGSYETKLVEANLKGLLKNLNFECRIHGIDDND